MELKGYVRSLRESWWLLVAATLVTSTLAVTGVGPLRAQHATQGLAEQGRGR